MQRTTIRGEERVLDSIAWSRMDFAEIRTRTQKRSSSKWPTSRMTTVDPAAALRMIPTMRIRTTMRTMIDTRVDGHALATAWVGWAREGGSSGRITAMKRPGLLPVGR